LKQLIFDLSLNEWLSGRAASIGDATSQHRQGELGGELPKSAS